MTDMTEVTRLCYKGRIERDRETGRGTEVTRLGYNRRNDRDKFRLEAGRPVSSARCSTKQSYQLGSSLDVRAARDRASEP